VGSTTPKWAHSKARTEEQWKSIMQKHRSKRQILGKKIDKNEMSLLLTLAIYGTKYTKWHYNVTWLKVTLSSQASKKRKSALWSGTATPDCCRARERDGCEVSCAKNALFCTNTLASTAPADALTKSGSSRPLTTNRTSFCTQTIKSRSDHLLLLHSKGQALWLQHTQTTK
jgi:hypothetical protein